MMIFFSFSFSSLIQCSYLTGLPGCPKINFLGSELACSPRLNYFSFSLPLSEECWILQQKCVSVSRVPFQSGMGQGRN